MVCEKSKLAGTKISTDERCSLISAAITPQTKSPSGLLWRVEACMLSPVTVLSG